MVVENVCDKCGNDVEYTITVRTNKADLLEWMESPYNDDKQITQLEYKMEYWCLPCIFRKIPCTGLRPEQPYHFGRGLEGLVA